jgi:predicted dehydrogenase
MRTSKIGMAVIGAGRVGPNLVRNAMTTSALDLKYLCDRDFSRARKVLGEYSTVVPTADLSQVLADPAVEAVAVATPAATHYTVVMAALEAGKHVLVENPLAASYRTGAELVATAADRGLALMLDHTSCYTPAVTHLRRLVQSGALGDLQFVDSVRSNLGLVQPDIDVLWDLAAHDLSILDSILPLGVYPIAVSAQGSDPIHAGRACVAHLSVQLSNGAMAHAHVNWLSPTEVRTTTLGGSLRAVVWDDLDLSQRLAVYDRGVERSEVDVLDPDTERAARISYRKGDMVAPAVPEGEALRDVMTEFVAAINQRRSPMTDGHAGLRLLAMLEAATESLASNGAFMPVEADLDDPANHSGIAVLVPVGTVR